MNRIVAIYDRLLMLMIGVVCALIALAMVFVSIDVVARYFFNRPLAWVFEFTEYFMLFAVFLGMAGLVREDRHVRVDVVLQSLGPRQQAALDVICSLLAAGACGVAAYYSALSTYNHILRKVVTYGIYPIPKWVLIAVMCVGFTLTSIEFARRAHRRWRGLRSGEVSSLATSPNISLP